MEVHDVEQRKCFTGRLSTGVRACGAKDRELYRWVVVGLRTDDKEQRGWLTGSWWEGCSPALHLGRGMSSVWQPTTTKEKPRTLRAGAEMIAC